MYQVSGFVVVVVVVVAELGCYVCVVFFAWIRL